MNTQTTTEEWILKLCVPSLFSVTRRQRWGGWGHWSTTSLARSSAQSAAAAGRSCIRLRSGASAPGPPPSRYSPVSLRRKNTRTKSERHSLKIWSLYYYLSSYRQSISSSQACGEVLRQYAEARLPWLQWGSWWPERKCCAGSSWGHTPLCFSQHQTPG